MSVWGWLLTAAVVFLFFLEVVFILAVWYGII